VTPASESLKVCFPAWWRVGEEKKAAWASDANPLRNFKVNLGKKE
jgi:hypothetical protein